MEHAGIHRFRSKSAWFLIDGLYVGAKCNGESQYYTIARVVPIGASESTTGCPFIFARFFLISCNHTFFFSSEIIEINQTSFNRTTVAANILKFFLPLFTTFFCTLLKESAANLYLARERSPRKRNIIKLEILERRSLRITSRSLCNHWSESSCPPVPLWKNPPPYPPLCNDERKLFSGTSSRISGWASTICVS